MKKNERIEKKNNQNITRCFMSILKMFHLIAAICIAGGFISLLVILLSKNMNQYSGMEIYTDKILLQVFNTAVTYGFILMLVTLLCYSLFTEWGFLKYRFIIIKWVLTIALVLVVWLGLGSALSGMTSISDAGFHMTNMGLQYEHYWIQAISCLIVELIIIGIIMYVSIRKPFGKRDVKSFKYRKIVIGVIAIVGIMGIIMMFLSERNLEELKRL